MGEPIDPAPSLDADDTEIRAPSLGAADSEIALESLRFLSDHELLKGCGQDIGWRSEGAPCPEPEWTRAAGYPVSHSMAEPVEIELQLGTEDTGNAPAMAEIRGRGPEGLAFGAEGLVLAPGAVTMVSATELPRKIRKLALDIRWSAVDDGGHGARVAPARTSNVMYVTMARPLDDRQDLWREDGVTLKRMDTAVSWVAPLDSLDPHAIMEALLARFPHYTLRPSPDVPRKYRHPHYLNDEGGAWPMADYVKESGECQAIARLLRGVLRQLGVPGELTILLVWADPDVDQGRTPIEADWEQDPSAGLSATSRIHGRRVVAALVDGPVKEGNVYPPSHTQQKDGSVSPGLNRYEAFMRLTHEGRTRYYAPGAGVFEEGESQLRVFWGLIWASAAQGDGFRVEKIVAKY